MDIGDVVRRADLLAAGYTDDEIIRMLQSAVLTALRPGVYLVGERPPDAAAAHLLRVQATVPKLAASAVISHVSATLLHGLPVWGLPLGRVHATRDRRTGGRRGARVHVHVAPIDATETVTVDGMTVSAPARTVVDIARTAPFEQAVVVADAALHAGLVDLDALGEALSRAGRRPGVPAARRVLRFADGRSESVGESRSRVAMFRAGLPTPDLQVDVRDNHGRLLGRCDFGWEGVVGEFDGLAKYQRPWRTGVEPADVVVAEKVREDAIRAAGRDMVRWIWSDLEDFRPTAARIERALGGRRRRVA